MNFKDYFNLKTLSALGLAGFLYFAAPKAALTQKAEDKAAKQEQPTEQVQAAEQTIPPEKEPVSIEEFYQGLPTDKHVDSIYKDMAGIEKAILRAAKFNYGAADEIFAKLGELYKKGKKLTESDKIKNKKLKAAFKEGGILDQRIQNYENYLVDQKTHYSRAEDIIGRFLDRPFCLYDKGKGDLIVRFYLGSDLYDAKEILKDIKEDLSDLESIIGKDGKKTINETDDRALKKISATADACEGRLAKEELGRRKWKEFVKNIPPEVKNFYDARAFRKLIASAKELQREYGILSDEVDEQIKRWERDYEASQNTSDKIKTISTQLREEAKNISVSPDKGLAERAYEKEREAVRKEKLAKGLVDVTEIGLAYVNAKTQSSSDSEVKGGKLTSNAFYDFKSHGIPLFFKADGSIAGGNSKISNIADLKKMVNFDTQGFLGCKFDLGEGINLYIGPGYAIRGNRTDVTLKDKDLEGKIEHNEISNGLAGYFGVAANFDKAFDIRADIIYGGEKGEIEDIVTIPAISANPTKNTAKSNTERIYAGIKSRAGRWGLELNPYYISEKNKIYDEQTNIYGIKGSVELSKPLALTIEYKKEEGSNYSTDTIIGGINFSLYSRDVGQKRPRPIRQIKQIRIEGRDVKVDVGAKE